MLWVSVVRCSLWLHRLVDYQLAWVGERPSTNTNSVHESGPLILQLLNHYTLAYKEGRLQGPEVSQQ